MQERIVNEYFDWLMDLTCGERYSREISFRKLLTRLHTTPFRYSIARDQNRAEDGMSLRYRFGITFYGDCYRDILDILDGPCSVLEMMVALALHCEENIMDDPAVGNRTRQWFWMMVTNLGLGSMTDSQFDRNYVDQTIDRFLDRDYYPDGKGGLFWIRDCDRDLREVEIWYQLCWYLSSIT